MIRHLGLAAALAAAPTLALAAPAGWSKLMSPDDLAAVLAADDGVRVIQVSGDYAAGHVPGAVDSPYPEWRGPAENPGALPETAELQAVVQRLGIDAGTPVVVTYGGGDQSDFGTAARVYWTLKSLGVQDLAVLNGGVAAWADAGQELSTRTAEVAPSDYAPELSDQWRVSSAEVAEIIETEGDERLLDARPPDFFEGLAWHPAARRPGTLPDAENFSYSAWFEDDRVVGPERAREIAEHAGKTDAPLTVSFCNTGHWAAINWFALSELAGVDNTRLYAESMVDWSQSGREMANVPNRVTYYWIVLRNWVTGLFA